jgi:hypothetical protein
MTDYNFDNFYKSDRKVANDEVTLLEDLLEFDAEDNKGYFSDWNNKNLSWADRLQKLTTGDINAFIRENNIGNKDIDDVFGAIQEARNLSSSPTKEDASNVFDYFLLNHLDNNRNPIEINYIISSLLQHDKDDGKGYFNAWEAQNLTWERILGKITDGDIKTFSQRYGLSSGATEKLKTVINGVKNGTIEVDIDDFRSKTIIDD